MQKGIILDFENNIWFRSVKRLLKGLMFNLMPRGVKKIIYGVILLHQLYYAKRSKIS